MVNTANRSADTYLTIVEAAEHLAVHPSSIRRWIDQGRLPAYRIGDKRIGIRQADLAGAICPRLGRPARDISVHPHLTLEEQQRGLRALAELERLSDKIATRHGPFPEESWELLNRSRDERTRDVLRTIRE